MPSYSTSPATRSGIQAQVDFMTELTRRTYDTVRKLSELNMHFARQVIEDTATSTRRMASCTDPFQLAAAAAACAKPAMQHMQSYQQQLVGVLSGAQIDLARGAEAFMPEGAREAFAAASAAGYEPASMAAGPGAASRANGSASNGSGAGSHHAAG